MFFPLNLLGWHRVSKGPCSSIRAWGPPPEIPLIREPANEKTGIRINFRNPTNKKPDEAFFPWTQNSSRSPCEHAAPKSANPIDLSLLKALQKRLWWVTAHSTPTFSSPAPAPAPTPTPTQFHTQITGLSLHFLISFQVYLSENGKSSTSFFVFVSLFWLLNLIFEWLFCFGFFFCFGPKSIIE